WENRDLIFPNLRGGHLHPNHTGESFRRLLKDAGLPPMHFHGLCHSVATILLTMKVHPKVVREILGHSQITTTIDVYYHPMPSLQADATRQWDDTFGELPKKRGNRRGGKK